MKKIWILSCLMMFASQSPCALRDPFYQSPISQKMAPSSSHQMSTPIASSKPKLKGTHCPFNWHYMGYWSKNGAHFALLQQLRNHYGSLHKGQVLKGTLWRVQAMTTRYLYLVDTHTGLLCVLSAGLSKQQHGAIPQKPHLIH